MARERMVTRTVSETKAQVMGLQISAGAAVTKEVTLAGAYDNAGEVLKAVKKYHETDDYKPVTVLAYETVEKLYGMTEQEFLSHAKLLPPRKVYGEQDEA